MHAVILQSEAMGACLRTAVVTELNFQVGAFQPQPRSKHTLRMKAERTKQTGQYMRIRSDL